MVQYMHVGPETPRTEKKRERNVAFMYTYKGISQRGDPRKHYNIDSSLTRAVLLKNSRNKHSITRFDMEHRGALLQVCGHKQGLSLGIVAETLLAATAPLKRRTTRRAT